MPAGRTVVRRGATPRPGIEHFVLAARAIIAEHANIRATVADLGLSLDLHLLRSEAVENFVQQLKAHARRENEMLYAWARRRAATDDRPARRHWPSLFDGRLM